MKIVNLWFRNGSHERVEVDDLDEVIQRAKGDPACVRVDRVFEYEYCGQPHGTASAIWRADSSG